MSFVPAIRDYIELLNNVYDSVLGDITFQKIFQETLIFIFGSLKYTFLYIISFQWFRDFINLPILVPQITTSILKEKFFLENPIGNFFTFIETPSYTSNKFLLGFLNSFFLSLPITAAHLIFLRRFFIQGNLAGIFSGLGTVLAQVFFIGCIIFGLRFFIIPFFSFEPVTYILGIFLILTILSDMAHERSIRIIKSDEKSTLLKIFFLNFLLTWTEQSCIFQYFSNLTLSSEPTILETFSANNEIDFFLIHGSYLFGILIGSLFFNFILTFSLKYFILFISSKILVWRYSKLINFLNVSFLNVTLAFALTSFPYYGLDYLLGGPIGFVSQDKSFQNTIFAQNDLKDTIKRLGAFSNYNSLDMDVTSFDRGKYLKKINMDQSFEDLNYQGEFVWTTRMDRSRSQLYNVDSGTKIALKKLQEDGEKQSKPESSRSSEKLFIEDLNPSNYTNNIALNERFYKNYGRSNAVSSPFQALYRDGMQTQYLQYAPNRLDKSIEKRIKEKYYSNPVYKLLLTLDIDNFISRQPRSYILTPNQEKQLFEKRIKLTNYYDSLRFYNQLPYAEQFQALFNGSKSFADRVYNQQFKGTLRVVRRLFSINLNSLEDKSKENINDNRVLKFDQPLFTKYKNFYNPILHEELEKQNRVNTPFLEFVNTTPLYTGWDNQLRKLVITNRLLPQELTLFKANLEINQVSKNKNKIEFSSWPIPKNLLDEYQNSNVNNLVPYTVLFETRESAKNKGLDFRSLSAFVEDNFTPNIIKLDPTITKEILPPTRGGFIWPGHSSLKFSFKQLLNKD